MKSKHISELAAIIQDEFSWHKARCTCFAYFVFGVLSVCTVTLSKIAMTFSGMTQIASREKRLKRLLTWLALPETNYKLPFVKFVLRCFKNLPLTLSMDRTNWKFGACHINLLVIGVWYKGISIPIYWINLAAAGNSNSSIRIKVLKILLKEIDVKQIAWILADREFIGEEWFRYLMEVNIPFIIRIKDNVWAEVHSQENCKRRKVAGLFSNIRPGKTKMINNCKVYGHVLNLAACLSSEGDLVVVATNGKAKRALKVYKKRWSIESLFACLKGRGFNFEDTHIVDVKKAEALLLVLSFALFWSMQVGSKSIQKKPLEIAKHGRPRVSIFRRGLEILRESIIQIHSLLKQLLSCIKTLRSSCRYVYDTS